MPEEDINRRIAERLGGCADDGDEDIALQALAVLIDADLTDGQRAMAFESLMTTMLSRLSAGEMERFTQIALEQGEGAALDYLVIVTDRSE